MADYPIIDIEGIGETYAPKLQEVGVKTVAGLLERGKTPKGRKELAESTGINEKLILKWVNMGDLFRVKGIGPEYSELLEKAGVDTVKELRHRVPEHLHAKLEEANSSTRPSPGPGPAQSQSGAVLGRGRQAAGARGYLLINVTYNPNEQETRLWPISVKFLEHYCNPTLPNPPRAGCKEPSATGGRLPQPISRAF